MSEELTVNRVRSYTIGPGRSVSSARSNHFVIDEPPAMGGPGEAITPTEAFLAGINACGVLLVQTFAGRQGYPFVRAEATIEGVRRKDDPANFAALHMRFDIYGPSQQQAEHLVELYKGR